MSKSNIYLQLNNVLPIFKLLPDDAKEIYKNKLSLIGKITCIYLVFYLLLFFKLQFHLSM